MEAVQLQRHMDKELNGNGLERICASSSGLPSSNAGDPAGAFRCFACGPEAFSPHHRFAEREVPPAPRSIEFISSLPEHGGGHERQRTPRASADAAIEAGPSAASPSTFVDRPLMVRRRIRGKQPPLSSGILLVSMGEGISDHGENMSERRMTGRVAASASWCRPAQQSSWGSRVIIHRITRPSPCGLCSRPSRIVCRGCQGPICLSCVRMRSWCEQRPAAVPTHMHAESGHGQCSDAIRGSGQSSRSSALQEVEAIQRTVVVAAPLSSSCSAPVAVAAEAASVSHGIGPPLQRPFRRADGIADRVEVSPIMSSSAAAASSA